MSEIKYKNHILTAINCLRLRKARPDFHRISKYILRIYKISPKEIQADLQRCLKEKSIYKVDYKGNVSYRNANVKQPINMSTQSTETSVGNATAERRIITSAIATFIYQDQTYLENGIAFNDLVKSAVSQTTKYNKKQIEGFINKELSSGSLVKLPNGNLALGPADNDVDATDNFQMEYNADSNTKMTSSANSSCRSSPVRIRGRPKKKAGESISSTNSNHNTRSNAVRVGERRKMAKKVFDPSDNNISSKKKRGRPAGSLNKSTIKKKLITNRTGKGNSTDHSLDGSDEEMDQEDSQETSGGVCCVCTLQQPKGSSDQLIECRDCSSKAHMSCLKSGPGILKIRPDNTWQCQHCKTCVICCETNDAGILTVCSICADAYHVLCHKPMIPERMIAWDCWKCSNCLQSTPPVAAPPVINEIPDDEDDEDLDDTPPSEEDLYMKPHEHELNVTNVKKETGIDENIPDISDWTSDDVYDYFVGEHPEGAPILKEQEFDGQSLLYARRTDIVKGLGLPLGPALRLYRIVVKLQTRKDDWTMCWG